MTVEAQHGFEHALELDRRVWEVLARIQARKARELPGCMGNSPEELARCFALKLTADGHRFEVNVTAGEVRSRVHACPWLELLWKSGRERLAARISQAICPTEGEVWCAEFGGEYRFSISPMACAGGKRGALQLTFPERRAAPRKCVLRFARKAG